MSMQLSIPHRPFAVEPITGLMLPDGIFDTAIGRQSINLHIRNDSSSILRDVEIYLEGAGDAAIIISPRTIRVSQLDPGQTEHCSWIANIGGATPGKTALSVRVRVPGQTTQRIVKR